ncbi:hypothetical protein Tco_0333221, partial [Tanacetum coccineum]
MEEWECEQKLPEDYERIMKMIENLESQIITKKDLYSLLFTGTRLNNGEVWLSLSKDGKVNEMISATTFSYENCWSSTDKSIWYRYTLDVQRMSQYELISHGVPSNYDYGCMTSNCDGKCAGDGDCWSKSRDEHMVGECGIVGWSLVGGGVFWFVGCPLICEHFCVSFLLSLDLEDVGRCTCIGVALHVLEGGLECFGCTWCYLGWGVLVGVDIVDWLDSLERPLHSSSHSAGPSHKRCRSSVDSIPSSTPVEGSLAPTRAGFLPPHKRFRDSYSSKASIEEDTKVDLIETEVDMELGIGDGDDIRDCV